MQKTSYKICKQQKLYGIENNSKAHNKKKHQSTYSKHQNQSATPNIVTNYKNSCTPKT